MTEQYKCQSYADDNHVVQDCACGKCVTPDKVEEIVEEFDSKFYHDHEERGLTYLRNDVVGWLRTTLTEYHQQIAEALAEALEGEATINGMLLKERIVNIIKELLESKN